MQKVALSSCSADVISIETRVKHICEKDTCKGVLHLQHEPKWIARRHDALTCALIPTKMATNKADIGSCEPHLSWVAIFFFLNWQSESDTIFGSDAHEHAVCALTHHNLVAPSQSL